MGIDKLTIKNVYELTEDLDLTWMYKNTTPKREAFLPKGTKMQYIGKSIGCAHFRLLKPVKTWKIGDTYEMEVVICCRVFNILKEVNVKKKFW